MFTLEEEFNIRSGIYLNARKFLDTDLDIDTTKIFIQYSNWIDKLDSKLADKYLFENHWEVRVKMMKNPKVYSSLQDTKAMVFGRDAYLLEKARREGKTCFVSKRGKFVFDGVTVTQNEENFLNELEAKKMVDNEKLKEFGEDEENLPNIDDYL